MSHLYEDSEWEPVIGLEIHVELNTKSKLFSNARNRFGDEPNTNIGVVCTGQPGALPVLNREAVRKAVQLGCALDAKVATYSQFDRKSYFYPDSPRNFQITQLHHPIVIGGAVTVEVDGVEKVFPVNRAHLEDDAGMLKHFTSFAGVDYNRAGVPLIEIVSEPCLHTPRDAVAYAMAIKGIMQYIDASDCNMEEGSLRMDANISVRKKGEKGLRNKIEIKNMNSFYNLEMAIHAEIRRQIKLYTQNPDKTSAELIPQATYRWDPNKKETIMMRRKEDADDYRYFPEPDLLPIVITQEYIDAIRSKLPELPLQRQRRYVQQLQLAVQHAFILTTDKQLADYFEEGLKHCANARNLCNWIVVEFAGRLKESNRTLADVGIPAKEIAHLVNLIDSGVLTGRIAKSVADDLLLHPHKTVDQIVAEYPDYQPLHDVDEIT
ncbi:MAG: Asp-tRNA(Asn)/Glu-tRNA(Gln) amidotransferase subunit GatB, partial [Nitrosomonas sp.]|nr:Asp-tRNA(Asn)/Glu-tRNA(Gln) amidotransferase subunit GatB [Nitrosomonas sp.]